MKNLITKIKSFFKSPLLGDVLLFYIPCAFLVAGGLFHTLHDILKYADLIACVLLVASCIRSFIKDKSSRPLIITMLAWAILCDLFIHSITLFEIALICCASIGKDMRKVIKFDATIRILCAIAMIAMLQMSAVGATAPAIAEWQRTLGFYNPVIAAAQFFIIFLELLYADSWQPGINTVIYGGMSIYVSLFLAKSNLTIAMAIITAIIAIIVGVYQLKPLKKAKESAIAFVNKHELCYKSGYILRLYYPFICATLTLGKEALLLLIIVAIPVTKFVITAIGKREKKTPKVKKEQRNTIIEDITDKADEAENTDATVEDALAASTETAEIEMPEIAEETEIAKAEKEFAVPVAPAEPAESTKPVATESTVKASAVVETEVEEASAKPNEATPSIAVEPKTASDDFKIEPPVIPDLNFNNNFIDATMPPVGFDENLIKIDLPPFGELGEEDYM